MPRKVVLENVDYYRYWDPLFESVRITLNYRGEKYSAAYIEGISGAAFRIGGICPCAPTCDSAMLVTDLIHLLGYECEYVPVSGEGIVTAELFPKVLERIKSEIDAGRPVLLWNAFTILEWDVVAGYDEEKGELYGRGSYTGNKDYAHAPQMQAVAEEVKPALGVIFIGKKSGVFDAKAAELAALNEARRHARDESTTELPSCGDWKLLHGLACYDRWVNAFGDPGKKLTCGEIGRAHV